MVKLGHDVLLIHDVVLEPVLDDGLLRLALERERGRLGVGLHLHELHTAEGADAKGAPDLEVVHLELDLGAGSAGAGELLHLVLGLGLAIEEVLHVSKHQDEVLADHGEDLDGARGDARGLADILG